MTSFAKMVATLSVSSMNSHGCIGRTSASISRNRCTEFPCMKTIGRPSAGTIAQLMKVVLLQMGMADTPVAYRTFGSLKSRHDSTPGARIVA